MVDVLSPRHSRNCRMRKILNIGLLLFSLIISTPSMTRDSMRRTLRLLPPLVIEGAKRPIHPKQIYRHFHAFCACRRHPFESARVTASAIPAINSKNSSRTLPYICSSLPYGSPLSLNNSTAVSSLPINPLQQQGFTRSAWLSSTLLPILQCARANTQLFGELLLG